MRSILILAFVVALALVACNDDTRILTPPPGLGQIQVTSRAFTEGGAIPKKFTCSGENISPALQWRGAPSATKSLALIVDDPDAPVRTFTHWVAYDLPATQTGIGEGAPVAGTSGKNSSGKTGYMGPCPPSGEHRYIFTVFALDVDSLGLAPEATKDQVIAAMQGHILKQGSLTGRYSK
ncbi:MAG: YbhB/YbcL family Raf kinase inhibitor-like protein [Chloroflexi bacterium]|nr:YbhB/YbcL family Raf kinase inhibitor-like protein [Chloroflexota bacterium]